MITVAYWDAEILSFQNHIKAASSEDLVRRLLRGLAVLATDVTQGQPDVAEKVLREFHDCLLAVHDQGIEFHFESWLRSHASPEIAAYVEREFTHPMKSTPS